MPPAWVIVAMCYGVLVPLALARVARKQLQAARALETLRAVERDLMARARRVTVVGTPGKRVTLGEATQLRELLLVTSAGFDLRGEDEAITTIVRGVPLRVLVTAATLADGPASLPAGAALLYAPGDPVFLFEEGSSYFRGIERPRVTAWPQVVAFVAVPVLVSVMCALGGPATPWNAIAVFVLVALLADQTIGRGIASWGLCTRPGPP